MEDAGVMMVVEDVEDIVEAIMEDVGEIMEATEDIVEAMGTIEDFVEKEILEARDTIQY